MQLINLVINLIASAIKNSKTGKELIY